MLGKGCSCGRFLCSRHRGVRDEFVGVVSDVVMESCHGGGRLMIARCESDGPIAYPGHGYGHEIGMWGFRGWQHSDAEAVPDKNADRLELADLEGYVWSESFSSAT